MVLATTHVYCPAEEGRGEGGLAGNELPGLEEDRRRIEPGAVNRPRDDAHHDERVENHLLQTLTKCAFAKDNGEGG